MKNDDIAKGPSGRMNAQRATKGGSGRHADGVGRIRFALSTKLPSIRPRTGGIVNRSSHWRGSHANHATGVMTAFRKPEETFCEVIKKDSGFTLIELLITMSILGLIASFAMPAWITTVRNSRATICLVERQNIQVATDVYVRMNALQVDDSMPTITTLVSEGLLSEENRCPSAGIYVWNAANYKGITDPFFLYCSIHFAAP
jgi:prepilin-type N-terminal cleavage/methylation domain-containing protein